MGEIFFKGGDGDGDEREWVYDGGAVYHMTGDASLFNPLGNISSSFRFKQINGTVLV